jgi:hypothetical protein
VRRLEITVTAIQSGLRVVARQIADDLTGTSARTARASLSVISGEGHGRAAPRVQLRVIEGGKAG